MIDDSPVPGQAEDARAGLCGQCRHVQIVSSDRGGRFYLCRLSQVDPRFARYPNIPVLACPGFLRRDPPPFSAGR